MSEITDPPADPDVDVTPTDPPAGDAPDLATEVEKWKALARKNEQRAKDNSEKAKRLDEIEEASRTELEKVQAQLATAQQAAASAEAARLRASIAGKHRVPESLLTGSTEEDLEASAVELLAFKGTQPAAPSADGQGNQGTPIGDDKKPITSIDELKKLSPKEQLDARRDGRLNGLLGIPS